MEFLEHPLILSSFAIVASFAGVFFLSSNTTAWRYPRGPHISPIDVMKRFDPWRRDRVYTLVAGLGLSLGSLLLTDGSWVFLLIYFCSMCALFAVDWMQIHAIVKAMDPG